MPSLGADMEAGTLVEWLVKPGDWVKRGDVVAVVETQKGAIEIEIFQAGQIEQILVNLHSKVPVGTPLARIRAEGGGALGTAAAAPAIPDSQCRRSLRHHRCRSSRHARGQACGRRRRRAGLLKSVASTFQRSPAAVRQER